MAAGICSPSMVTPSRSFQSFTRSLPSQQESSPYFAVGVAKSVCTPSTPTTNRPSSESYHITGNSSSCSSPNSSSPNSNSSTNVVSNQSHYQRPSTLHGLKHKLHSAAKNIHSPNRRKSVGHIPLSPLARTPSPSPIPASPTRSPSPLAFPTGHQPGSSNTTQSYSPGTSLSTPSSQKKNYSRPKSAEPGSPLLRRALSPDRLHPRSAENKTSISPLANSIVRVTPRVTIAQTSHVDSNDDNLESVKDLSDIKIEKKSIDQKTNDYAKMSHGMSINIQNVGLSNSCGSTQLPRIAEEKDSPTNSKSEEYSTKDIDESEIDLTLKSINLKSSQDFEKKDSVTKNSDLAINSADHFDQQKSLIKSQNCSKTLEINNESEAKIFLTSNTVINSEKINKFLSKSKNEISPETRKILKRYKIDETENSITTGRVGKSSLVEDKKNK